MPQQYNDPNNEWQKYLDPAVLAGLGYAGYQGITKMMPFDPLSGVRDVGINYAFHNGTLGKNPLQSAASAVGDAVAPITTAMKSGLEAMPKSAKIGGAAAAAALLNNALGNPLGKGIDSLTGQATNLDDDPDNAQKKKAQEQLEYQKTIRQAQSDIELEKYRLDPADRFIEERAEKYYNRQKADAQQLREEQDTRSKQWAARNFTAKMATDLMDNWYRSATTANQMINSAASARFG